MSDVKSIREWIIDGGTPDGRAGDRGFRVLSETEAEARAAYLAPLPSEWIIRDIRPATGG